MGVLKLITTSTFAAGTLIFCLFYFSILGLVFSPNYKMAQFLNEFHLDWVIPTLLLLPSVILIFTRLIDFVKRNYPRIKPFKGLLADQEGSGEGKPSIGFIIRLFLVVVVARWTSDFLIDAFITISVFPSYSKYILNLTVDILLIIYLFNELSDYDLNICNTLNLKPLPKQTLIPLLIITAGFLIIVDVFSFYEKNYIFNSNITAGGLFFAGISSNNARLLTRLYSIGLSGPIIEELMHRGLLLNFLKNKINIIPAVIIVSLIDAAIHFNLSRSISLFLGFLFLTWLVVYTKSIYSALLVHIFINVKSVIVKYLNDSTPVGVNSKIPDTAISPQTINLCNFLLCVGLIITAIGIYLLIRKMKSNNQLVAESNN
ncbi:MAG: CPBP family intramembrane metalloprotease [candidate division Zixibacteria bacterium]|nr:CPBP family intramembrane metalloprotease [candidate division Zixibacteria bacterium]